MAENRGRGSIGFSSIYRPGVPLDIYSCPRESQWKKYEVHMTDGVSYNYNGQVIPAEALKTILQHPKLASEVKERDIDSGVVFVSERGDLETLHIALRFKNSSKLKVFGLDEVFDTFNDVRMEDSGCVAGDYLIYVSTKEPAKERRQPWTAVYKTNLNTGITERLTPKGQADLNPSVSPSGNKIAVASFQRKGGWDGEIEDLQTDIFVMNVEKPLGRKLVVKNGGWPTWGSENVLFFHRKVGEFWGVFRADISNGETARVTPQEFHAITPAAINDTRVAVATIREQSKLSATGRKEEQYRHIEIFDSTTTGPWKEQKITQNIKPLADHFNPFVIHGGEWIGYHRCNDNLRKSGDNISTQLLGKVKSPLLDVQLFRVRGVSPTFSNDGSKLAFADNEFKTVWLADSTGLRIVYKAESRDKIFSPVWNPNPNKDTLYVCMGPSFSSRESVDICALPNVSSGARQRQKLTKGFFNDACPSANPEGTRLVFRSTRDGYKNLYIMEDVENGEYGGCITRLTSGPWTDTHCQWSPTGNWIVFSSTRDKPIDAPESDNNLDPGYFAVFLVNVNKRDVVIRVMEIGSDIAGHVNHPFFSPDGMSIVVTADLAGVSVDPISLPLFQHSVRPYGDIFTFDIDPKNIENNKDLKEFTRITHSRYENSPSTWTMFSTQYQNYAAWNQQVYTPASCPYNPDGGESFNITGHLCIPRRCC